MTDGGGRIAEVLEKHGVRFLFTLCGGHISPILVGAKRQGIRVVDVRDEANAVFAADAVARLSGVVGVAAVTAGPGVTNTITAIKNAQMAQSPLVVLGGATGTVLKGRGSLQDIDQLALVAPHVKWAGTTARVRELIPALERALRIAQEGVPGPVFLECPVDLLYPEGVVRDLYMDMGGGKSRSLGARALGAYLGWHVNRLFRGAESASVADPAPIKPLAPQGFDLGRAARWIERAKQPVLMVGSQALVRAKRAEVVAAAVESLGIPTFLSGMARGLLGQGHPLQMRHKRRAALKGADLVILAGVPFDFRLDYGRQISSRARIISANLSEQELRKNRNPDLGVCCDAGAFLEGLAARIQGDSRWDSWTGELRERDEAREKDIDSRAAEETDFVNPLALCREIDSQLAPESVLVADGGDFVATASYSLSPRGPLSWLDPGVFGTLGVGGGFALGAKLCRPDAEVWILYGDGSAAYSIAEFDTFVRHDLPVIAVVGNDASWAQIAREQIEILEDDVGTVLRRSDYHIVAEGFGGKGLLMDTRDSIAPTLAAARAEMARGRPVLVNALLGRSDFRKGSISM
ncbi:MAG: thiamine pyrophosphate-binding protein [Thermoanaerobaculia bacterium]